MHLKTIIFVTGALLGIVVGYGTSYASEIAVVALALAVMQMLVYVVERKREASGVALSLCTFLFAFGIVIGAVRVQLEEERVPVVCESSCTFDAIVISSPETKDAYQTLIVRTVEENKNTYDIQLRTPLYPSFMIGETLRVSGKVRVPEIIFPHGNEKSFDYVSYLHTKSVGSEMLFPTIEVIDTDTQTIRDGLGRWKEEMVERMNQNVASPASSLAAGMLFGNSSMSQDLVQTFRVAGLSHIIVLSGFNIAIVIAFVLFVFAFLPLVIRIVMAAVFVIVFVMMVGGEASVMRATVMAFVALLATLVGRPYVARQALILSLFAIVMYEPNALLHDASLHLSFLATAGIVYLSETIKLVVERYISRTSIVELFTTTSAAYLATLPYVMHTFGTVSVYALLANMAALPVVPIAMLVSFLVVLTSYISETVSLLVGFVDTMLINIILFVAHTTEGLPFSSFNLTVSFGGMILLYVAVTIGTFLFSKKKQNETLLTTEAGHLTDIIPY